MLRRALLAALVAGLVASCASVPPVPSRPPVTFAPLPDEPFSVAGRLSARHGSEGVAANVRWQHDAYSDELLVATPMGD